MKCTTHFDGCPCREERMRRLERLLVSAKQMLRDFPEIKRLADTHGKWRFSEPKDYKPSAPFKEITADAFQSLVLELDDAFPRRD